MSKPSLRRRGGIVRRRIRSSLAAREANSAAFEARLTWIFGSPRSGSTWLLGILAEHPDVVAMNEPLIGWYLGPFLSDMPGGDASALDDSTFTLRRLQSDRGEQFFSERYVDIWLPNLARMMRERLYAYCQRYPSDAPVSRRQVMIKEPNGSQSADIIMRALPRSRLLFLLRDGRDVVDSELAAILPGSWVPREFPWTREISDRERLGFVTQSAKKWLWRTEVVQTALAAHPGARHTVRYEDLVKEPQAELRRLFDWLRLSASDSDITAWIERNTLERMAGGVTGPQEFFRSARPGSWRENLREDEQAAVERVLGPKLRELGYDT